MKRNKTKQNETTIYIDVLEESPYWYIKTSGIIDMLVCAYRQCYELDVVSSLQASRTIKGIDKIFEKMNIDIDTAIDSEIWLRISTKYGKTLYEAKYCI